MPLRPDLEPDFAVWAYPHDAISNRKIDAFVIADLLADVIAGSPSASSGYLISSAQGGQWNDWQRLVPGLGISNCGFGRFLDSGLWATNVTGTPVGRLGGGMYLLPTPIPLPASTGGGTFPGGDGGTIPWTPLRGTWDVVPALDGSGTTGVYNSGDDTKAAVGSPPIPEGQPLKFDFSFFNMVRAGGRAAAQMRVGPNLRMGFYEGIPPVLEVAQTVVSEYNGALVGTQKWDTLHSMDAWGAFSPRDTHLQASLQHIAGRLIWEVDGHKVHLMDGDGQGNGKPIVWGGTNMRFDVENVKGRVETHMLSNRGNVGQVKRRIAKKSYEGQTISTPRAGGHIPKGTSIDISTDIGDDYVEYTATLRGNDAGTLTPLLSEICLIQKPVWVNGSAAGVNIADCVTSVTVNHAHPPLQAGTDGKLDIHIPTLQRLHPGVGNWLGDFCPIEVSARWRNGGSGVPLGPYRGLLRGYLMGTHGNETNFQAGTLSYGMTDPVARMRAPAGIVSGRAAPLDPDFMDQLDSVSTSWKTDDTYHSIVPDVFGTVQPVPDRLKQWYDVQCIHSILKQFQGPAYADTLNDGDLFQFLPADHPPLIDYNTLRVGYAQVAEAFQQTLSSTSLQMQNGFLFEPPYKSDELSWINKFAADMICTFLVGYANRDHDGWPIPLYGRYDLMMNRAKLFTIPAGELKTASIETRPELRYNGVWFIGNNFDFKIPLSASLNQGMAELPYGHPESKYETWERLKIIESNLAITPQSSAVAAAIALAEMDNNGNPALWPTYEIRGDNGPQIGDVLVTSESKLLDINDQWFRAAKLAHKITQHPKEGRNWDMAAALQQMSRSQIVAFCRANNLPIPA